MESFYFKKEMELFKRAISYKNGRGCLVFLTDLSKQILVHIIISLNLDDLKRGLICLTQI